VNQFRVRIIGGRADHVAQDAVLDDEARTLESDPARRSN